MIHVLKVKFLIKDTSNLFLHGMNFKIYLRLYCSDPHSGISRNDLCLGHTPRDCDELAWTQIDYSPNISFIHQLTDGKEIFVKIKAVNNGIATDCCKCVIF